MQEPSPYLPLLIQIKHPTILSKRGSHKTLPESSARREMILDPVLKQGCFFYLRPNLEFRLSPALPIIMPSLCPAHYNLQGLFEAIILLTFHILRSQDSAETFAHLVRWIRVFNSIFPWLGSRGQGWGGTWATIWVSLSVVQKYQLTMALSESPGLHDGLLAFGAWLNFSFTLNTDLKETTGDTDHNYHDQD